MIQKEISDRITSLKCDLSFIEFGMLIQTNLKNKKRLAEEANEIKSLIARLEKLSEVRKMIDKNKV
jgi:hypothetical protein